MPRGSVHLRFLDGRNVAANKRKILENARKLAQKGSKDKALKEYDKLVKLDPRDAKLRLEIGDAHRRWGQVDEAVATYTKVAEQYMKEGFDARAVAVYKQILNLAPDRLDAYVPLAELYERMGLTAEAIQSLQTAADGHHKAGDKKQALELLRKMSMIDPTNTMSRIKVAELLRQEDMLLESMDEYQQVATELERQGDVEAAANVHRRILEMDSKRVASLVGLAKSLLAQGNATEAEPPAKRALEVDDNEPEHYDLLADIYRGQKREDLLPDVYKGLAEVYRRRGDEDRARDILQRFVPSSGFSIEGSDDAPLGDASNEEFLAPPIPEVPPEDELSLGDDSFSAALPRPEAADELDLGPELEFDDEDALDLSQPLVDVNEPPEAEATVAGIDPSTIKAPTRPESGSEVVGDPDQLLAEASVYLRYGKRDKAIAHLESILRQDGTHRVALEKMGEALAEDGKDAEAVDHWVRAAKVADQAGDSAAVAVLHGRIEALDPAAATDFAPAAGEPDGAAVLSDPDPTANAADADVDDFDLDIDDDAEESLSEPPAVSVEPTVDAEDELDLDIDFDEDEPVASHPAQDLDEESASELDISLEEEEVSAGEPRSLSESAPPPANDASLSTATTAQLLEDLEEADFYMEQELHDEAEEIYKRVLSVAPNHPRALVRLGEVAAARGEDPGASAAGMVAQDPSAADRTLPESPEDSAPDLELSAPEMEFTLEEESLESDDAIEVSEDDAIADDTLDPVAASVEELVESSEDTPRAEAESVADEEPAALSPVVAPESSETVALDPEAAEALPEEQTTEFEALHEAPVAEPPSSEPVVEEANFDLAAELSDVFDEDPNEASGASEKAEEGFAAVFDAFKKGVSETLSEADHEAHFDLGIAYKEMGLYDDAIAEFRASMVHPPRVVECLHLIGLCALDAQNPALAAEHLEQLLETDGVSQEQQIAARFELARAFEGLDRIAEAKAAYLAVLDLDPNFPEASKRYAALDVPDATPPPNESEFESFEDVVAEVADEPEPESTGETFDDLVAEANAEDDAGGELAPEPPPPAVPEPAATGTSEPASPTPAAAKPAPQKSKKKRKKISFL